MAARTASDVAPIPPATVAEWRRQLGEAVSLTAARVEPWVTKTLLCERRPPSIDHRVKRVLRDLPNRLSEAEAVSLDAVAASVGLSASRFLHLFTTSVGVPLRRYVLWLACNVAPVNSRAARPSPRRRTRPVSPSAARESRAPTRVTTLRTPDRSIHRARTCRHRSSAFPIDRLSFDPANVPNEPRAGATWSHRWKGASAPFGG